MKPFVYVTKPIPKEIEELLAEHCTYEIWPSRERIPRETLLQKIREAEGLLTSGTKIDHELLCNAPKLKIVSNNSVGYDNFDIDAMKEKSVIGTHTPYILDDTVADLAFGLILSSARRIAELDRYVRDGKWTKSEDDETLFGSDVHHQTLGIIGMGRIGEQVAKRAAFGFDMEVLYYSRSRKPDAEEKTGAIYTDFNQLLERSDFIVLITPLTDETYHLIGERELKQMKRSAIFINISRGQTVDEKALIKALQEGWIKGAGLDVFEKEPITGDNPLVSFPNVTLVPHIGSSTLVTHINMLECAAKNLIDGLKGRQPKNIVKELK
ncbi:D-glycerate dehydrogenase [Bacillus swezeyi]|uniref:Bifunctional glyoxylate/hydroxypyruvate reductase B n=1 Tax=Bacillus swezeyi TaxID=1925020 RepID=A0A1R1Q946_9BACI|nr:D-glycerate dehydrogenase [Bacillus swezeyi]MEC1259499.1 D-glycerate dehydrogenase [Bacillus swezeyi]MED2927539.1 D-glycerate dehydrogenase [Bacillus swezeyi]MED2962737.1 D-glycerate dehydrogenase [Bacillus swezeyi]MED2977346.1 D-glycerate dehydrogenase [Bacillus swezeyi]MED3071809.1 D-glycerate dehydrogenase [Bacillus swezeyi]